MKLKELLSEDYKTRIDDMDTAIEYIKKHCSDALAFIDTPIVRGMTFSGRYFSLQGDEGGRESANTSNHYTAILDTVLGDLGYPLRSKSIICANWAGKHHAAGYGDELYAILPYNGVKIGVCPGEDMWDTKVKLGFSRDIEDINRDLRRLGVAGTWSFAAMVKFLEVSLKDLEDKKDIDELSLFGDLQVGKIEQQFREAYAKPFKLATTADAGVINDGREHELWIGGKCIAIQLKQYDVLKAKLNEAK